MIGLCCQYIENNKNMFEEKSLQFGQYKKNKYSKQTILETWISNIKNVQKVLPKLKAKGYSVFRLSSNLFSLFDQEKELLESFEIKRILKEIGEYVISNNIRLTTHPDQFVVLSSKDDNVVNNSLLILEHHSWIFDSMNLPTTPYYSINIHGGAGNQTDRLLKGIEKLSDNCRQRLTLENDEISYFVDDLYEVYKRSNIPICFDSHHHSFNGRQSIDEALDKSMSTWTVKPLTHLSNSYPQFVNSTFQNKRKHSDMVHYIPDCQLEANNNNKIDIDFEFKLKNIAIEKAAKDFGIII